MTRSARFETLNRAFWVAVIPGAVLFAVMQTVLYARTNMIGADSHAYWVAARLPDTWYTSTHGYRDAYLYSPAFAQLLSPLGKLPWIAFQSIWCAGQIAVLAWLLAPCGWRRGLTLAAFCVPDLLLGNVYVFYAGALVLSVGRVPGALAFPLLTKISPGLVVGVWFVVRREWRAVLWAVGVCAVVLGLSAARAPGAWLDWVRFLADSAGQGTGTFIPRLVLALCLAVWAARTSRAWLLAPAMILALPLVGAWVPYAILAAIPRLRQFEQTKPGAPPTADSRDAHGAPRRSNTVATVEHES